jgi:hypothetical protein
VSAVFVKVKEMFSFQQGLSGTTVHLIADSCQNLKKLSLHFMEEFFDEDVIHIIKKLGKQLATLVLDGGNLTDDTLIIVSGNVMLCGSVFVAVFIYL